MRVLPIYRAEHKKDFTIILNAVLSDTRLSYGARGLMAHVLTHHDNWVFTGEDYFVTDIDKKTKVRGYIKELVNVGYLKRVPVRNEKGIFQGYKYEFHENPFSDLPFSENPNSDNLKTDKGIENKEFKPFLDLPNSDKPFSDKPFLENRKLNNTNINNTNINNIYSPLDSESYIEEVNKKLEEDLIKKITSTYDKALVMNELKKLKGKNLVGIDLLQELERNLKASKKENCSNEVKEIFEYWNSKNIIKHKAMSNEIKKAIEKSLKVRSKDEIVQAIEIYSEILNSDFYFNHKWSLRDFLNRKNGISTFIEEGSNKSNYEEWKKGLKLKDKIGSKEKKEIKLRGWD